MEQHDIFISYRRQDAEAHAYMLYRDLVANGYSVFYDHKSLGAGNFVDKIKDTIEQCKDVIVILSKESLSERIHNDSDIMHQEIAHALKCNKRIVGIMLSGFEEFPKKLPEDIAELPQINCLYSKMEYYDAMFERLISGQFLISTPSNVKKLEECENEKNNKISTLARFKKFPLQQKQQYMNFLLDLAHEFNSSPECMRLYNYLDNYDRNRGVCAIEPYQGCVPTDYATYLSFFETLYLILYTETLDIALVDEMYRFRFFAMCNNPLIQKSELLPLGHQYPNVLELYDKWNEYVRVNYYQGKKEESLNDIIPLWDFDLHRRYNAYKFIQNPVKPRKIRLLNKIAERKDFELRQVALKDYEMVVDFQTKVLAGIENNDQENIFEPLTEIELKEALSSNNMIALYEEERIAALLSVIPNPEKGQNLLSDLKDNKWDMAERTLIIDCILVDEECRGYGIQKLLLELSEFIAERWNIDFLTAVVSPKNYFSTRNFIKAGYQLAGVAPKYHSVRNYFAKDLREE